MTADDRRQARDRIAAATPGPWGFELSPRDDGRFVVVNAPKAEGGRDIAPGVLEREYVSAKDFDGTVANYRFIARARADLPAALDMIDALEGEVRRLREQIEGHAGRIAAQSEILSRRAERGGTA